MAAPASPSHYIRILTWSCYWGLIGVSTGVDLWRNPEQLAEPRYLIWLAGLIAFGVASTLVCRACMNHERIPWAVAVTGFQAACVLLMAGIWPSGYEVGLLSIVAAQIGFIVSLRAGFAWVVVQTAIYLAIRAAGTSLEGLLWTSLGLVAFQALALSTAHFWASESRAKRDLIRTNAELRLSQELLASTSRLAERQRISRELHDLLGHHLTAIGLNLEVASHLAEGEVAEHVRKARELNHQLLGDVREAVSTIRGDVTIDVRKILDGFAGNIQSPHIHIAFPQELDISDPIRAHTLLRCAQEIITNAIRHAAASNLWLDFARTEDGVVLKARDDGRGVRDVRPGTGLTGMRERLEQVGGRLDFWSAPHEGFRIEARMPLEGAVI